jgi:hypothetical protein
MLLLVEVAVVAVGKLPQERRAVGAEAYLTPTAVPAGQAMTVTASPRRCGLMRAAVEGEATLPPTGRRAVLAAAVRAGALRQQRSPEMAVYPIRVAVEAVLTATQTVPSRGAAMAVRALSSSDTRWPHNG